MPRLTRWLPTVAVALLLLVVLEQSRALSDFDAAHQVLSQRAERQQFVDRHTGTTLPPLTATSAAGPAEPIVVLGQKQILWILDPERCFNCMREIRTWNFVADAPELAATIVLTNTDSEEAASIQNELDIRGRVLHDPTGTVAAVLQLRLAASRLLLGEDGTVMLADARYPGNTCAWSFEGQVASLLDLDLPVQVRSDLPNPMRDLATS